MIEPRRGAGDGPGRCFGTARVTRQTSSIRTAGTGDRARHSAEAAHVVLLPHAAVQLQSRHGGLPVCAQSGALPQQPGLRSVARRLLRRDPGARDAAAQVLALRPTRRARLCAAPI